MSEVNPEYTEGNIVSFTISDGIIPNATNMDFDVANGVMATDDSESGE